MREPLKVNDPSRLLEKTEPEAVAGHRPEGPCAVAVGHGFPFSRKAVSLSHTNRQTRHMEAS